VTNAPNFLSSISSERIDSTRRIMANFIHSDRSAKLFVDLPGSFRRNRSGPFEAVFWKSERILSRTGRRIVQAIEVRSRSPDPRRKSRCHGLFRFMSKH
jgi:hypothetical protein